jgi:hypothetical protein
LLKSNNINIINEINKLKTDVAKAIYFIRFTCTEESSLYVLVDIINIPIKGIISKSNNNMVINK